MTWRDALGLAVGTGCVTGTLVGLVEGLVAVSANAYLPQFALPCFSATVLLTTSFFALGSVLIGMVGAWRRWPGDMVVRCAAGVCVAIATGSRLLLWWADVSVEARQSGGNALLFCAPDLLLPIVAAALGLGVSVLLRGVAPRPLRQWVKSLTIAAVGLNVVLFVPPLTMLRAELRGLLPDSADTSFPRRGRLNVLLLTIDTLRADRLAYVGGHAGAAPHLDRLAAQGVAFTTAISQSPWTMPSLASILTGLTPSAHGAGRPLNAFDVLARTPIEADAPTVTESLRRCGYRTQAIVTNPFLSMRYGFGRGFEGYENVTMESESFIALRSGFVVRLLTRLWPALMIRDAGGSVTRRAEPWLTRHRREPFFLWVHYIDAHAPYGDPEVLGSKSFRGDLLPARQRSSFSGREAGQLAAAFVSIARLRAGEIRLDAAGRAQLVALYDAGVRYVDAQVGHVLDLLDRLDLAADTLVIVASDHGEEFWEHGGVEHGHTLYDELIRVPLIMRSPRGPAATVVTAPVRLIDIAPTILDATGCASGARSMDGQSVQTLLDGTAGPVRIAVSENLLFADEKRAVRIGALKYIVSLNGKEELYDLAADPGELRDLAARDDLLQAPRALAAAAAVPIGHGQPVARLDDAPRERVRILGYEQ